MDDANEIYREARQKFLEKKEQREIQQRELRQAAEIVYLGGAKNMREYNERREALKHHVYEPEKTLDDMSTSDFIKLRNKRSR